MPTQVVSSLSSGSTASHTSEPPNVARRQSKQNGSTDTHKIDNRLAKKDNQQANASNTERRDRLPDPIGRSAFAEANTGRFPKAFNSSARQGNTAAGAKPNGNINVIKAKMEEIRAKMAKASQEADELDRLKNEVKNDAEFGVKLTTLIELKALGVSDFEDQDGFIIRKRLLKRIEEKYDAKIEEFYDHDADLHHHQMLNARVSEEEKRAARAAAQGGRAENTRDRRTADIPSQISALFDKISYKQKKIATLEKFMKSIQDAPAGSDVAVLANQLAALAFDVKAMPKNAMSQNELLQAAQDRQVELALQIEKHERSVRRLADRTPSAPLGANKTNMGDAARLDNDAPGKQQSNYESDLEKAKQESKASFKADLQRETDEDKAHAAEIEAAIAASLKEAGATWKRDLSSDSETSALQTIVDAGDGKGLNTRNQQSFFYEDPGKPSAK